MAHEDSAAFSIKARGLQQVRTGSIAAAAS
jgi:hypothetical protein